MSINRLLFTTILMAYLASFSSGAHAADSAIKATSIAQTEVEVIDNNGNKTLKREPVVKAVPGNEVIFTTTFENTIGKPASNIVINNPIPKDTEYKGGSAFGKDCEILFSVDGGKKFGHTEELKIKDADGKERIALPKEYTNIRWTYKVPLAPGKTSEVGFRATIK
jgi:uncharacterized repeat protein (TIGR01451 family)